MVILYILLILSLSLGVISKIEVLPNANIYLFDVISIIIVFLNARYILFFLKKNYRKFLFLFLFFISSSIGILFHVKNNTEFLVSISYLFRLILYLVLFIPLVKISLKKLSLIKNAMLVSGLLFISLGYIQYIFYPNLRNLYYLGWDEHLYRLFSTFLDPNFAGMFIVLVTFLYFDFLSDQFKKKSNIKKYLFLAGFFYIVPSLFLTYSRSSLIAFFITVVYALVFLRKKIILLAFIICFILFLVVLPKNFGGEGVKLFRTASLAARSSEYIKAWDVFLKNPILGVGFNTLRYSTREYGYINSKEVNSSHAASGIPNSYLYILATTGILGITFLTFAIVRLLGLSSKFRLSKNLLISTSCLSILTGSLFENYIFYAPITLWLIILIGVTFRREK